MNYFKEAIERIEKHTGKPFDFTNNRHRFHLQESMNREISKRESKINMIHSIIENPRIKTFDSSEEKAICLSNKERGINS